MKAAFTTIAGLFAAGAIAIPSAHQHEHLHRRQPEADAPVEYVTQYATQVDTNTVVQYVDSNGNPMNGGPSAAPSQGYRVSAAGYGQQPDSNSQFATVVTAAQGQQATAQAWNWGNANGGRGGSWSYGMPAHSGHGRPSGSRPSGYGQQTPAGYQSAPSPSAVPQDSDSSTAYQPAPTAQPVASQQTPESSPAAQYSAPAQSSAQYSAPAQSSAHYSAPVQSSVPVKSSAAPVKSSAKASPTSSSAASPSTSSSCDIDTVVKTHNLHRANHSVPDIAWHSGLAQAAQMVANKCSFTHDTSTGKDICGFDGYGQNFACTSGTDNIADDITGEWYSEETWYEASGSYGKANPVPYTVGGEEKETGHFTQIVWKASTHVGCAVANCPNGVAGAGGMKSLTVCNYGPPGNFGGEYADNVPKPKGGSSS